MVMRRITKLRKQRLCALTAAILATAWMPSVMAANELPVLADGDKALLDGAVVETPKDKQMKVTLTADKGIRILQSGLIVFIVKNRRKLCAVDGRNTLMR